MSRTSTLLWLALVLGSAMEPARAELALAAPVDEVRKHLGGGRIEAAIASGEKAVATLAQDSRAWFWLGRAYAQQALRASLLAKPRWAGKARAAYEKSVELDPDNLDARFDLMQYYTAAPGFLGGSRENADAQAAAIRARDAVRGKLAEAHLANVDQKPALAERAYREALTLDPASEPARTALAMFLQRGERWAEIRTLWNEVLARDPGNALAHYQLGRLSAVSGEALEAGLAHLATYLAQPQQTDAMTPAAAHWRRGQILERLGRRGEALAALQESLRLQPEFAQAREELQRLQDA